MVELQKQRSCFIRFQVGPMRGCLGALSGFLLIFFRSSLLKGNICFRACKLVLLLLSKSAVMCWSPKLSIWFLFRSILVFSEIKNLVLIVCRLIAGNPILVLKERRPGVLGRIGFLSAGLTGELPSK